MWEIDSDKQREICRAKKAHQKGVAKNTGATGNLFDDIKQDRQEQARLAREEALREQAVKKQTFLSKQVDKAHEQEWFVQLKPGTVAQHFASLVLENFKSTDLDMSDGTKRTDAAEAAALYKLTYDEVTRDKAISHGRHIARTALKWAYDELDGSNKSQNAQPNQPASDNNVHLHAVAS